MKNNMSEKISPRKGYYKGHAPLNSDNILKIVVSTLLQIIILSLLYSAFIERIKLQYGSQFLIEVVYVIILMIISDGIAFVVAYMVKEAYDLFLDYIEKEKKKKPRARAMVQYILYTLGRSIIYAAGFVTLLSAFLYPYARIGNINFSYLLAWLLISLPIRIVAWGLALKFSI